MFQTHRKSRRLCLSVCAHMYIILWWASGAFGMLVSHHFPPAFVTVSFQSKIWSWCALGEPILTGAQARPALLRLTPFLFLFELYASGALFKSQAVCCFANMEVKELSFPTSLRFILPLSGSLPRLPRASSQFRR